MSKRLKLNCPPLYQRETNCTIKRRSVPSGVKRRMTSRTISEAEERLQSTDPTTCLYPGDQFFFSSNDADVEQVPNTIKLSFKSPFSYENFKSGKSGLGSETCESTARKETDDSTIDDDEGYETINNITVDQSTQTESK